MKRGQLIADKLAALIVEKMEKRAGKGDWKELKLSQCFNLLVEELQELKEAFYCFDIFKHQKDLNKAHIRDEIADVAAYCAIMLDVLEKE